MSIWLRVTLIVFAAVVVNLGISFISLDNPLPSSAAMQRSVRQNDPVVDALLVRPPQAAVDACLASTKASALTHDDFVRLARCLHRRRLMSTNTVAAVERDHVDRQPAPPHRGGGLKAKPETAWWSFAVWAVALALIILVVFRHRRRPPPGRGLPTSG